MVQVLDGLMLAPGAISKMQMQFRLAPPRRNETCAMEDFMSTSSKQQLDEIGTRRPIGGVGFEVQGIEQILIKRNVTQLNCHPVRVGIGRLINFDRP
jgi:hypothetical protein